MTRVRFLTCGGWTSQMTRHRTRTITERLHGMAKFFRWRFVISKLSRYFSRYVEICRDAIGFSWFQFKSSISLRVQFWKDIVFKCLLQVILSILSLQFSYCRVGSSEVEGVFWRWRWDFGAMSWREELGHLHMLMVRERDNCDSWI